MVPLAQRMDSGGKPGFLFLHFPIWGETRSYEERCVRHSLLIPGDTYLRTAWRVMDWLRQLPPSAQAGRVWPGTAAARMAGSRRHACSDPSPRIRTVVVPGGGLGTVLCDCSPLLWGGGHVVVTGMSGSPGLRWVSRCFCWEAGSSRPASVSLPGRRHRMSLSMAPEQPRHPTPSCV